MAFPRAPGYNNLPNGNFSPVIYSKQVQLAFRKAAVCDAITITTTLEKSQTLVIQLKSLKNLRLLSKHTSVVQQLPRKTLMMRISPSPLTKLTTLLLKLTTLRKHIRTLTLSLSQATVLHTVCLTSLTQTYWVT